MRDRIHFVTGRLAEHSLRTMLAELAPRAAFDYTIEVLPITVAALMTPRWIARHVHVPEGTTRLLLPGYCDGDLAPLRASIAVPIDRGPRDLRELPDYFGKPRSADTASELARFDIQILAEINHAPRLALADILQLADSLRADGADVIDVGCEPGDPWLGVGDCVRALRDAGHRVSVDSLTTAEIELAARAGAELILSVNSSNREAAVDWGCEVVAIPDDPRTLAGLDETIDHLATAGVPLHVDPIVEPIGCGFAASLGRYLDVRRRYPDAQMLMGIGNLTELTAVDSAGVNMILLGFCQELGIRSVLTTQVIPWARTSVRECALARRLVRYAEHHRSPPKHLDDSLVMLRDGKQFFHGQEALDQLAQRIKDHNYRLFAEEDALHLIGGGRHLTGTDPFSLFGQLLAVDASHVDASHAFYLGYEFAKAVTARTLGKQYRQDEALDWGFLTVPEQSHRLKRTRPVREENSD